jgi:FAD:protein FMN transferase
MEYIQFRAMNSDLLLAGEGDPYELRAGFRQAQAFIAAREAQLSRFLETSELSQLNRASGRWFPASLELYELVREAQAYVGETGGLFDPSILDALERAGYDKSMDQIRAQGVSDAQTVSRRNPFSNGRDQSYGALRSATSKGKRFADIEFDDAAPAIRLPRGMRIDLGGIAKGWIAERAARVLGEYASACVVNAGGDLFTIGLPEGKTAWPVELEDPRDPAKTLTVLYVGAGAVATSSITKRRWVQGERVQHHLIDPRTGQPAQTDWLSVTVLAPHATTAEVFAKTLLIAGPGEAERIASRRDDLAFIAVDAAGRLWGSIPGKTRASNAVEFLNGGIEYAE